MDTDDYWFQVRPSNTEAILRIVAEGQKVEIYNVVENLINGIERMVKS